jgi:hypothetical protein
MNIDEDPAAETDIDATGPAPLGGPVDLSLEQLLHIASKSTAMIEEACFTLWSSCELRSPARWTCL